MRKPRPAIVVSVAEPASAANPTEGQASSRDSEGMAARARSVPGSERISIVPKAGQGSFFGRSEALRLGELEEALHASGLVILVGTDEAGRGPLAGPVVAAAVCMKGALPGLNDSKKLSAKARETLFDQIRGDALAFAIVERDAHYIDTHNILAASLDAMREAVETVNAQLRAQGLALQRVMVDGNQLIRGCSLPQTAYVKGDSRSFNIAAASVLAKVHRDRLMVAFDRDFPGYGLARHMGYPTAAHFAALRTLGPSPIHRRSFRGVVDGGPSGGD